MGIKNLKQFIRKKHPNIIQQQKLSDLADKIFSIDISLYVYKYKAIYKDSWLRPFISLLTNFKLNKIKCIFVFDGKPPVEKQFEKNKRKERKKKLTDNICKLKKLISEYKNNNIISDELSHIYKDICKKKLKCVKKNLILTRKNISTNVSKKFDINIITSQLKKLERQIINISHLDFVLIKEFLKILKIPYIQAQEEAEKICVYLCKIGLSEGVISEDTDILAYFNDLSIFNIDINKNIIKYIKFDNLLSCLELNKEQFLDFCIMSGNDYNPNIYKIGSIKSYNLIKKHNNIENIDKMTDLNTTILNYKNSRKLFNIDVSKLNNIYTDDIITIKNNLNKRYTSKEIKDINNNLKKFLFVNNIKLSSKIIIDNIF